MKSERGGNKGHTYQNFHVEHFVPFRFPMKEKHEFDIRNLINHAPTSKAYLSVE